MKRREFLKLWAAGLAGAAIGQTAGCVSTGSSRKASRSPEAMPPAPAELRPAPAASPPPPETLPATPETLRSLAAEKDLLVGTACDPCWLQADPAYREVIAREFNCLVAENAMKLEILQPERGQFDFRIADAMMEFAARHDMRVRAVPLVWHDALPAWAKDKTFSRSEALDILRDHIFTVMGRYRGRVFAWDVLNEGINEEGTGLRDKGPWFRSIGPDYVEKVYRWAHEADPQAKLFYNDYAIEGMSQKADWCYQWIRKQVSRGVPIHGLGLQYHVRVDCHPEPADVLKNIKRFNDLDLAVHITELDVWLPNGHTEKALQEQADVYRQVFETAFAAPNCPAVVMWGFTDRYSWVPGTTGGTFDDALIFDRDYRPKPAYDAIRSVLREG